MTHVSFSQFGTDRIGREGERRHVTAVFYDIVGSTEILVHSDFEEFRGLQRRIHNHANEVFKSYGGYIDTIVGDGGNVYFGLDQESETATAEAVSAALEFLRRCAQPPSDETTNTLRVRIGVATGLVVIADNPFTNWTLNKEIVGIAPVVAARLEKEAEPDSILVSATTHQLTSGVFDYVYAGQRSLKGFNELQDVWRPIKEKSAATRFSLLRSQLTPFVSREHELAVLQEHLTAAWTGIGRTILINGEPGIGKSRLVEELRQGAQARDFGILTFQCQPRAGGRPLHPIIDHLKSVIPVDAAIGIAEFGDYRWLISKYIPSLNDAAVEHFSRLLSTEVVNYDSLKGGSESSEAARSGFIKAAVEAALAFTSSARKLIVFEDLQWADTLTASCFSALADQIRIMPVLLIGTSREVFSDDKIPGPVADKIILKGLSQAAVESLIRAIWQQDTLPKALSKFIFERSDGVPLFVEELTRRLAEGLPNGVTSSADWQGVLEKGVNSLADLLSSRLAAVGGARRFAQVASTIGREFSISTVAGLVPEMDMADLENHAAELITAGLIEVREPGNEKHFRFRHSLIQEVAHEGLLRGELQHFHNRIVQLALDRRIGELSPDLLAWHSEQAGRYLEAANFGIVAAETYASRSAIQEADLLLSAARRNLEKCKFDPAYAESLLRLLTVQGVVTSNLQGIGSGATRRIYEEGVQLCTTRGPVEREKWFPIYWGYWFTAPDFKTQLERAALVIGDLESSKDPETKLQALHCGWATAFNTARHQDCLSRIQAGLTYYDSDRAVSSRYRYGHDAKVCGLGEKALVEWLIGKNERASKSIEQCLTWANMIDHLGSSCHALDIAITLEYYRRNIGRVAELALQMHSIAESFSLPSLEAKALIFDGWSNAINGAIDAGTKRVERGLDLQQRIGTSEDFPVYYEILANLWGIAGRLNEAILSLNATIERAESAGHLFWMAELYRRRAELRRARGDELDSVKADLVLAEREARRQGAIALLNRISIDKKGLAH